MTSDQARYRLNDIAVEGWNLSKEIDKHRAILMQHESLLSQLLQSANKLIQEEAEILKNMEAEAKEHDAERGSLQDFKDNFKK